MNYVENKLMVLLFSILPFTDALNGILYRRLEISGVGIIYHVVLLSYIFFLMLKHVKFNFIFNKFNCLSALITLVFLISGVGNLVMKEIVTTISIQRVFKILYTFYSISFIYTLLKNGVLQKNILNKIIYNNCMIIPVLTFIANICGISNSSYISYGSGKIGFYTNLNEATIIFIIIAFYLLNIIKNKPDIKKVVIYFMNLLCILSTESKSGIISSLLFTVIFIWINRNIILKLISKYRLVFLLVTFIVAFGFILYCYPMISTIIYRQSFLFENLGKTNIFSYLTSGRINRFYSLLISPLQNYMSEFGVLSYTFKLLFGFGFISGYYQIYEMDVFDIMLFGGICAVFIFMIFIINLFFEVYKNSKFKDMFSMVYLLFCSCFIGHIWTGGVCGVYYAIFVTYLMTKNEFPKRKVLIK